MHTDGVGHSYNEMIYTDGSTMERPVAIVTVASGNYVIVIAARGTNSMTTGSDFIRLIEVDAAGVILNQADVTNPGFSVSGPNYENLIPMDATFVGGTLFICGFTTTNTYTAPNYPDFGGQDSKTAFVVSFDITTFSATNARYYDYTFAGPPTLTDDYDIAMRIQSTSGGNLFVTGCANVVLGTPTGEFFTGGSMQLMIDPTTLASIYNVPILSDNAPFSSNFEYSIGFTEDATGSGDYYTYCNYAVQQSNSTGFDPYPVSFHLTGVDNTLQPRPSSFKTNRMIFPGFDYAWANTVLPTTTTGTDEVIGYQNGEDHNCPVSGVINPPTADFIMPFFFDLTPAYSLTYGIQPTTAVSWYTVLSGAGTGNVAYGYSFPTLGGGQSTIGWAPRMGFQFFPSTGSQYNILSAPYLNSNGIGGYHLNVKHASLIPGSGTAHPCSNNYCNPSGILDNAVETDLSAFHTPQFPEDYFGINTNEPHDYVERPDTIFHYDCYTSTVPPYFKHLNETTLTPSQELGLAKALTPYPNPAKDFISIKSDGINDKGTGFKISITDITGKQSMILYNGTVANMPRELQLPQSLANGTYVVTIRMNDRKDFHYKIGIVR